MAELKDLEARIQALEDLEAIKRLKYEYLRCLDTKDWDGMARTFAEDATTSYSDGELSFKGRDAIMKFLRESAMAQKPGMVGVHHVHHPEIDLTSPTAAKGIWALYNYLLHTGDNSGLRLCAFYHDEYVKIDGRWKIKSTGYQRVFEELWDRKDSPSLKLTKV
jgi:bile-acid 7alpha-dehydratase